MSATTTTPVSKWKNYWLLALTAKMRKLKINPKVSENIPIFPPEIEEMILERITDQPSIYLCRLVSSHWKSMINSLLEQRRLALWTTWEPEWTEPPEIPGIETTDRDLTSRFRYIPEALESPIGNPFPSNSLTVFCWLSNNDDDDGLEYEYPVHPELGLTELAPKLGHYLTSLVLRRLKLFCYELEFILIGMPNLKALTLSEFQLDFMNVGKNETMNKSVCPPHLEHLKLLYCTEGVVAKILPFCAHQLVTLQVEFCGDFPAGIEMGRLKHFKIDDNSLEKMTRKRQVDYSPNCSSLTHLSIRHRRWVGESTLRQEIAVNFVSKFSLSLKVLYLDLYLGRSDGEISLREAWLLKLLREGESFPHLEILVLPNRCGWTESALKETLKVNFPSLKCVNYCSTY